jgi:hypothetical protein
LLCNFAYPEYYVINPLPPATLNPYNGARYIQFLKQRSGDYYRVFSRSAYLYPNWSSAFGLYDVRYLAAIHFNDFFQFVRAFLAVGPVGFTGDLADRFTGDSFPNPASWKQRRFFQLSSIRYLVGGDISFSAPEVLPLISNVLGQNQTRIRNEKLHYIERRVFTIDGEARDVFFEHPPASRLALSTVVPANGPILTFSPAFDPRVFGRSGDGVDFTLELQEPDGKVSTLYHRYVDAKQNPGDRHWLDTHIDLRRYAGKKITLLFSTGPGPRGDAAWDWAGWGGLRFVVTEPAQQSPRALREVYDGETAIAEYPDVLPRVSVFYSAVPVSSQTEALSRIQDPSLDIWRQLVISTDGAGDRTRRNLESVFRAAPARAQAASIRFYDSQRVSIRAVLERPGIVMLTDSNYPGWGAYLDGHRVPILSADYLFRGVAASAGAHEIEFRYEPKSYFCGGLISLSALLAGLAWLIVAARRHRVGGTAI